MPTSLMKNSLLAQTRRGMVLVLQVVTIIIIIIIIISSSSSSSSSSIQHLAELAVCIFEMLVKILWFSIVLWIILMYRIVL